MQVDGFLAIRQLAPLWSEAPQITRKMELKRRTIQEAESTRRETRSAQVALTSTLSGKLFYALLPVGILEPVEYPKCKR